VLGSRFRFAVEGSPGHESRRTSSGVPDSGSSLNPPTASISSSSATRNRLAHARFALRVPRLPVQAYTPSCTPRRASTDPSACMRSATTSLPSGRERNSATRPSKRSPPSSGPSSALRSTLQRTSATRTLLLIVRPVSSQQAKTEDEFFHTFNALYATGRQFLVLTFDVCRARWSLRADCCASASRQPWSADMRPSASAPL